jgi:hypothetical protein
VTLFISAIGLVGRFIGAMLTTTLGWASSLLFGRVPRSHQIFVVLMLSGALLWIFLIVGALISRAADVALAVTPHPGFIDQSWVHMACLIGIAVVPLGVGIAAYLVPDSEERPSGVGIVVELLRGYVLTPILALILLFLPAVGISRKARSVRHRWADLHVPVVVKPKAYDRLVTDLVEVLTTSGLPVEAEDAPRILSLPALLLTSVSGRNVRKMRPDRLVELEAPNLRIGVYPSDLAISGPAHERTRARAAIMSRLATTAVYLTTSAEAQAIEDRLGAVSKRVATEIGAPSFELAAELATIDASMLDLPVPADEWDILFRLRLRVERDALAGVKPPADVPDEASVQQDAPDPGRAAASLGEARSAER